MFAPKLNRATLPTRQLADTQLTDQSRLGRHLGAMLVALALVGGDTDQAQAGNDRGEAKQG